MAVPIAADSVIRLRVICFDNESQQVSLNVTYWKCTSAVGVPTDADLAFGFSTAMSPGYIAWMSSRSRYAGCGVQVVLPTPGPEQLSDALNAPGSGGSSQVPTQVSGIITFHSDVYYVGSTGKHYNPRGRIYPGFPSRVWTDGEGKMTDAGFLALSVIADQYPVTAIVGRGGRLATLNLSLKTLAPTTYPAVSGGRAQQLWATQRRRGDFGQRNINPLS